MALVRQKQRGCDPFKLLLSPFLRRFRLCCCLLAISLVIWTCCSAFLVNTHHRPLSPPSQKQRKAKQYVRYNKRGTKQVMKAITEVRRDDLRDLNDDIFTTTRDTLTPKTDEKKEILSILRDAGITKIDADTMNLLPTWNEVTALYGDVSRTAKLFSAGLDTCRIFRDTVPAEKALVGTAGLFNSGTNAMTYYLRANLLLPDQSENQFYGILTQVPWDKHFLASLRHNYTASKHYEQYNEKYVLPIVVIRDPLTWLHLRQ